MLRIATETAGFATTVRLEGRLAGPWVDELARTWLLLRTTGDTGSVRAELDGLTFVSPSGLSLLRRMYDEGAILVAHSCMTRAIVEEIRS